MRAVFVKGRSEYDATRIFVDELADAFTRQGYSAVVIDALGEPDLDEALAREAAAGPTAFVYTVGMLGEKRDRQGRSVGQVFGAPHVLQHVDYPLSHLDRLESTAAETALLLVDPTHVEAVRATFGEARFAHIGFGPHAAVGEPAAADESAEAFVERRPIPLLFAGTYYGPGEPAWRGEDGLVRDIFDTALETALGAEFVAPLEALDLSLRAHGLDPADPALQRTRKFAMAIHEQVRRVRRRALLDAAGAAGLPVHIVGAGYEGQFEHFPTFRRMGAVSLSEVSQLMRASRLVLNVNANFGAGSHERPLSAMLAGAAVVSDYGAWWDEHFVEDREIAFYRWKTLDADLERVAALLADPAAAWPIAKAGQERVLEAHRFDQRTQTVVDAARLARARRPDIFAHPGGS
ncbi:glycosyltransferase family protein [Caulobacter sp. LARHSG274]